jgi:hypothetical protein
MRCLLGCLAFLAPRAMLVVLYFQGYLATAFETALWPLLGFVFMPLTTIAYAWGMHQNGGSISGFYLVMVVLGVLADLGVIGSARSRRDDDD